MPVQLSRLCVFCGSNPGKHPEYLQAAQDLAADMVRRKIDLVYGGTHVGAMGAVANGVRSGGGHVIGVLPKSLLKAEIEHREIDELRLVASMHERKALMAELADGFIALPGGFGTMEEFFEVLTWNQLALHEKPVGVLNVRGFFDPLLQWMENAVEERFMRPEHRDMVLVSREPGELIGRMQDWKMPQVQKWLDREPQR